jgi:hypothetical protein
MGNASITYNDEQMKPATSNQQVNDKTPGNNPETGTQSTAFGIR